MAVKNNIHSSLDLYFCVCVSVYLCMHMLCICVKFQFYTYISIYWIYLNLNLLNLLKHTISIYYWNFYMLFKNLGNCTVSKRIFYKSWALIDDGSVVPRPGNQAPLLLRPLCRILLSLMGPGSSVAATEKRKRHPAACTYLPSFWETKTKYSNGI